MLVAEDYYLAPTGRHFVRVSDDFPVRLMADHGLGDYSDQKPEVIEALQTANALGLSSKSKSQLTDYELAHALRAVAFVNGRIYLEIDVDEGRVSSARAFEGTSTRFAESFSPDSNYDIFYPKAQPQCAGCGFAYCCGTDNRWPVGGNTNWPYATILATMRPANTGSPAWGDNVADFGCTWQLIGRTTALAVAHCFMNPITYVVYPTVRWGAAPDAADNYTYPIPGGYPTWYGGYSAYVPYGWYTSNPPDQVQYDMAVISFYGHPIPYPGDVAGWVGWGMLNDADTLAMRYQLWGVPKCNFSCNNYNPWPRIWGSTALQYPSAVGPSTIDYPGDCSPGNSGSGLYQYVPAWGGWYVTGSSSRFNDAWPPTKCRAHRIDSAYLALIQAHSVEY